MCRIINHVELYEKLKQKQFYGEEKIKMKRIVDKLYEWQVTQSINNFIEDSNIKFNLWED